MSRILLVGLAILLFGCNNRYETLRPALGPSEPAIQALVARPDGAGPFPVLVVLHGCGGVRPNGEQWAAEARALGFMTVVADQFAPLGVEEVCTAQSGYRLWERARATHSLVRLLQARSDVRADRVFIIGFSQGGLLAVGAATTYWDSLDPPSAPSNLPRPAGTIALYPLCTYWPPVVRTPLLLLLPALDDWTRPEDCQGWVSGLRDEPRPRIVMLEGAYHSFDNIDLGTTRFVPNYYNTNRPTGFGATVGYNAEATALARREVISFLQALR